MSIQNYKISIRSAERNVVQTNHFELYPRRITLLFGESGIGKSLLSKAIFGLLDPAELEITINEQKYQSYLKRPEVKNYIEHGFFVFQEPSSHLNPLLKLEEQLDEGSLKDAAKGQGILRHLFDTTEDKYLKRLLEIFPRPYRPSGGEKQRILLAMAFKKLSLFLQNSNLSDSSFVFDEPSGSLDDHTRNRFLSLLFSIYRKKQFSGLLITHDYSIIGEIYRNYQELIEYIHLAELVRDGKQVVMRDFAASKYLTWLGDRKKTHSKPSKSKSKNPVVQIDSGVRVFGRDFKFMNGPEKKPTDLMIAQGEMIYLKAPSGMGKTTVAKILMGLIRSEHVRMKLFDHILDENTPSNYWRRHIWGKQAGMVFQHADEALNLQSTVKKVFSGLPLPTQRRNQDIRVILNELFDFKITVTFLNQKIAFLSGGQKQRLNLLRTLVLDTGLLILDEPINGLDFESIQKVIAIIEEKRKQGIAILLISHNEEIFDAIIDKEQIYYLGEIQ